MDSTDGRTRAAAYTMTTLPVRFFQKAAHGSRSALLLASLLIPVTIAAAQEPPGKPVGEAIDEFDAAARQKSSKRLAAAARQLARSAAASGEKKEQSEALKRLRMCLRHPAPDVRVAGAEGYGTLALRGSSRDLLRLVEKKRNKGEKREVVTAALAAWGRIRDPKSHGVLLAYIKVPSHKSDLRAYARAAARALGDYRPAKGNARYQFLREFMQAYDQVFNSVAGGTPSAAATQWWATVSPEMLRSFNEVVFEKQVFDTYEACRDWWRKNHRHVKAGRR